MRHCQRHFDPLGRSPRRGDRHLCGSGRACRDRLVGPAANGKANGVPSVRREAVLQGAPRVRPHAGGMLREWPSAPQRRAGPRGGLRKGGENRAPFPRPRLSHRDAKGKRFSRTFPLPAPWPRRFCGALGLLLGISPTLVCAQGAHGKTASHMPMAKPMRCHWRRARERGGPTGEAAFGPQGAITAS